MCCWVLFKSFGERWFLCFGRQLSYIQTQDPSISCGSKMPFPLSKTWLWCLDLSPALFHLPSTAHGCSETGVWVLYHSLALKAFGMFLQISSMYVYLGGRLGTAYVAYGIHMGVPFSGFLLWKIESQGFCFLTHFLSCICLLGEAARGRGEKKSRGFPPHSWQQQFPLPASVVKEKDFFLSPSFPLSVVTSAATVLQLLSWVRGFEMRLASGLVGWD